MCEINPKHALYFQLEAFTSHPDMTKEEFETEVPRLILEAEMRLNATGRFRFHIHPLEGSALDQDMDDACPTCRAPFDEPHREGCPDAPEEVTGHDVDAVDDLFDRSDWPPERTS